MNCDNEIARQMAADMIGQVTPFYVMAALAIVTLSVVVIGGFRRKVTATPIVRGFVTMALVVAVVFTVYRFAYDRAVIRAWTDKACAPSASGDQ